MRRPWRAIAAKIHGREVGVVGIGTVFLLMALVAGGATFGYAASHQNALAALRFNAVAEQALDNTGRAVIAPGRRLRAGHELATASSMAATRSRSTSPWRPAAPPSTLRRSPPSSRQATLGSPSTRPSRRSPATTTASSERRNRRADLRSTRSNAAERALHDRADPGRRRHVRYLWSTMPPRLTA